MIHASFDDRSHKSAAIAGIYQYDTGQRLKMHGLPSPRELAERDDFLSGDAVTVQAQYGFVGDSQTETRMASYDEGSGCWTADIPDIYLTRSSTVKVFVYVGYGAAEGAGRSKTCYEGSFTPVSRPAYNAGSFQSRLRRHRLQDIPSAEESKRTLLRFCPRGIYAHTALSFSWAASSFSCASFNFFLSMQRATFSRFFARRCFCFSSSAISSAVGSSCGT